MKNKISRIITANLSSSEQSALNVFGALLVVIINTCINFFLSPYITEQLGVEANGYITLANNFISYFGLITTALDSMAGRFMLISIRKNDFDEANRYYSSVLFGDWILSAILLVPVLTLIIKIDSFIQVSTSMLLDIKILFALVFVSFFMSLCIPKWSNSTFSTNRLYLRSVKTSITTVIRALFIYLSYKFLPAFAFYVALAGVIANILNICIEYYYKSILLPELHIRKKYFEWSKIKILISSGMWNTVSQCGNILLEGLDVLIANLFINPVMSGVLSLSKIIPNMINQIVGTIGTTFGPRIMALYADEDYEGIVKEVKNHIKIVSVIANIPIGGTLVFGTTFFSLWVPSQDSVQLTVIVSLTLFGMLFSGVCNCVLNIFTATNNLKLNSISVIFSGLINILVVYILLRTTTLGVYAIAGVSSFTSILRIFLFTAPYAAKCINRQYSTFVLPLMRAGLNVIVPVFVAVIVNLLPGEGWIVFGIKCLSTGVLSFLLDYFVVLNREERNRIMEILKRK